MFGNPQPPGRPPGGAALPLGTKAAGVHWRRTELGHFDMKTIFGGFALALVLALATAPAGAKGCIKGAVVGGIAGHYAGHHAVLGAAAGCLVGRHAARQREKALQNQSPDQAH